jgi:hypothetical protein
LASFTKIMQDGHDAQARPDPSERKFMPSTTRTYFAAAFAIACGIAPLATAHATDGLLFAYAQMERNRPDFLRREVISDQPAAECAIPQEDMECTSGN